MDTTLKKIMDEQIKDCGIESVFSNTHLYTGKVRLYIEQQYRNHLLKTLTKL
jgi:hypothetical protein